MRYISSQLKIENHIYLLASLVAQLVKNLPVMQEPQFQPLIWEDSPGEENGNLFQYSCLQNPMDREEPTKGGL